MDDSLPDDLAMYGDDADAPLPQGDELSGVDVVPISLNVPEHAILVLRESFHPEEYLFSSQAIFGALFLFYNLTIKLRWIQIC